MTAAAPVLSDHVAHEDSIAERSARRAARIRGIAFSVLGLLALNLAVSSLDTPANFKFWIDRQGGAALDIKTSVGVLWIIAGVVTGATGLWQLYRGASFRWRAALGPVILFWVTATFATLLAGKTANLTGVFQGTLALAAPISLGAFAGVMSERSGMANIAIEGKLLIGACVASIVASIVKLQLGPDADPFMYGVAALIGVLFAALAAALTSLLLAWLGIRWKVDQFIAGIVINFGAVGITNFLFLRVLTKNTELNTPPSVEAVKLPLLGDIPVLGPILFNQTPYVYFTILLMIAFTYMLFRTRWGLRVRASGEKPSAAGTVGIDVVRIRYRAMLIAGLMAGIGGSALSLASAGSFQMGMSAGKGFIALAAVIFGAWNPVYAFGAALVFGFADSAQALLSILGVDVPPQLLNSVPYIVTIIVVAGVVGRVRGPAAVAQPYDQG
ncbi:MAG TPA: ABC transporter permease [Candidatus Limnocylindrales bacterium]|jgi:simple sugar transport system permease protein